MATTLRKITEDDLERIMNWRMSETVTRYMNTNPRLTIEGQKKWLASLDENDKVKYWMIEVDGTPAGLVNLADINWAEGNSSWGYYIGEETLRSLKLAISLEMSLNDNVTFLAFQRSIMKSSSKMRACGNFMLHVGAEL